MNFVRMMNSLVGVVSHDGTGRRYWGPISVVANAGEPPAIIAQEDFLSDTIVDVKPYVPLNWHPEYAYSYFGTGSDNTGFTFDSTQRTLTYRHKDGVTYPITCRLIPNTNLEYRDYEFSGWIIKPNESAYDSVEPGVVFYYGGENSTYRLRFGRDHKVYLTGGGLSTTSDSFPFLKGDSVFFKVAITTDSSDITPDAKIKLKITLKRNSGNEGSYFNNPIDIQASRLKSGACGITVDIRNQGSTTGLRYRDLLMTKVR